MSRFLMLARAGAPSVSAPPDFYEAVDRHIIAGVKAGAVLRYGGLAPAAMSVRVRLADGVISTFGGADADAAEQLFGYALLEAGSQAGAVRVAADFMDLHHRHLPGWSGTSEIWQVFQPHERAPS